MVTAKGAAGKQSAQQRAILDYLRQETGHVLINATAGAGKTTTLVQIARASPPNSRSLFLAFARDAAQELQRRLGPGISSRTVHSLGRDVLSRHLEARAVPLASPDSGKYSRLSRQFLSRQLPNATPTHASLQYLSSLVNLVRLNLTDPTDVAALEQLARKHDLWLPTPERGRMLNQQLPRLLALGAELGLRGDIDFIDMIYLPATQELTLPAFDLICVDEAQDYSPAALELTLKLARRGARLVFVGDPHQAIFGFAGASSSALQLIRERTSARIFPLAVSYRCPRLHVELARRLSPAMEASPAAPAGTISVVPASELAAVIRPGDLVLCRLNTPLHEACLRVALSGLSVALRGEDLLGRLLKLSSEAIGARPQDHVRQLLRQTRKAQRAISQAEANQKRSVTETAFLQQLCTELAGRNRLSLEGLHDRLVFLFTPQKASVTFSTIHRAKGMESDRVILLYPELLPAPYARSKEALQAERCLKFVALTRAKRDLVIVEAPASDSPYEPAELHDGASPEESLRDDIIRTWFTVLQAARSGRQHRKASATHGSSRLLRR